MSQQNLDFGSSAAGDGETLAAAFRKIQDNTSELYAAFLSEANIAVAAAAAAVVAQTAAETAAAAIEAAVADANVYADTTAGLAAVSEGEYFWVPSDGVRALVLYRDVGGVATEITTIPSALAAVDLHHYSKSRYDTETGAGLRSDGVNRLTPGMFSLRQAVRNTDGTFTIPPGDYIQASDIADGSAGFPDYSDVTVTWTIYAVALNADIGTALRVRAQLNGVTEVGSTTTTYPAPGITKYTFLNNTGGSPYSLVRILIFNDGTEPLTIYWPELYIGDDSVYLPRIQRCDDIVAVPSQPVRNYPRWWETWAQDRAPRHLGEKQTTVALDSVNGVSLAAGTLYAPKKLIADLPAFTQGTVLGLYRDSTWRETLYPTVSIRGIVIQDIADGCGPAKKLPIVSALDEVEDGDWVDNADGTYTYTWTAEAGVTNDGYYNVFVAEIDTDAEDTTPIAARSRLTEVASGALAIATIGSAYIESLGANQWRATIRPSDDEAPGTRYRYEVVARVGSIHWTDYARDGAVSGAMLVGASHGYGALAAPVRFVGDRLILLHGTTHHAVINGGTLQRSLLYGRGDDDSIGLTFYTDNGAGYSWKARQIFWYGVRFQAFYCHTGGTAFDLGELSDAVMVNERDSNGALYGVGVEALNLTTWVVRRAYVVGYQIGYQTQATVADCQDSIFQQCARISLLSGTATFRNNIAMLENQCDPGSVNGRGSRVVIGDGCLFEKNIVYGRYRPINTLNGDTTHSISRGTDSVVQKNIFLIDTPAMAFVALAGPADYTANNNVVITVGCSIAGTESVGAPDPNLTTWEQIQYYSGQDADSLFVDLQNDPRGVKAVFVDPDNGDFRWAQTDVARRIAAYCAENDVGPDSVISEWPAVPTVDEAAEYIHTA